MKQLLKRDLTYDIYKAAIAFMAVTMMYMIYTIIVEASSD